MDIQNMSTLDIHKLSRDQYDRIVQDGTIDEDAIYIVPPEKKIDLSGYATIEQLNDKADVTDVTDLQTKVGTKPVNEQITDAIESNGMGIKQIKPSLSMNGDKTNYIQTTLVLTDNTSIVLKNDSTLTDENAYANAKTVGDKIKYINWCDAGTSIPSNSDLNTYTTPGKYYVSTSSVAPTITNAPITDENYVLFVFTRTTNKQITQMIITYRSKLFIRNSDSAGTLGAWKEMAYSDHNHTELNDITSINNPSGTLQINTDTLDLVSNKIQLKTHPTSDYEAATKYYVDTTVSNIDALPTTDGVATKFTAVSPLKVKGTDYSYILFTDSNGNNIARVHTAVSSHRMLFYEYGADGSGYSEQYRLPTPNDGLTASKSYNILTTKSAVKLSEGGTGATDGATGLKNMFAAGSTVLSSYQYGDTLPDPGTPGRIFFLKASE